MDYPWYDIVNGGDIEQGEVIENCPVLILPPDVTLYSPDAPEQAYEIPFETRDVIVLSQTCDMVMGQERTSEVLLCAVWRRSDLETAHPMHKLQSWEDARKGRRPAFHILNKCDIEGFERDFGLVDFRRVHSLPLDVVSPHISQGWWILRGG